MKENDVFSGDLEKLVVLGQEELIQQRERKTSAVGAVMTFTSYYKITLATGGNCRVGAKRIYGHKAIVPSRPMQLLAA